MSIQKGIRTEKQGVESVFGEVGGMKSFLWRKNQQKMDKQHVFYDISGLGRDVDRTAKEHSGQRIGRSLQAPFVVKDRCWDAVKPFFAVRQGFSWDDTGKTTSPLRIF